MERTYGDLQDKNRIISEQKVAVMSCCVKIMTYWKLVCNFFLILNFYSVKNFIVDWNLNV